MSRSPTAELTDALKRRARDEGFDLVGAAPLGPADHPAFYRWWLDQGLHGTMGYLERDDAVATRLDPASRWPELRSALVVAHDYGTDLDSAGDDRDRGTIARYARGRDYHKVVKKKLLSLLSWLEAEIGRELPVARAYVDTGPILERELAQRAGLGWQGRNTVLIHPGRGSYFFLGSLLLPLELEYDEPFTADRCGTCHACVDACPTGALLGRDENGAPVIDATRCISYLTIENRGPIREELRPLMGNRVYGCDICQEVCPYNNERFVQITGERDYLPRVPRPSGAEPDPDADPDPGTHTHPHTHMGPSTASPSLVELMRMTREEWNLWTRGSAIRRAGYGGFKRNVAVAMGNWLGSVDEPPEEAVSVLLDALEDESELVREHAAWALTVVSEARSGHRSRTPTPP